MGRGDARLIAEAGEDRQCLLVAGNPRIRLLVVGVPIAHPVQDMGPCRRIAETLAERQRLVEVAECLIVVPLGPEGAEVEQDLPGSTIVVRLPRQLQGCLQPGACLDKIAK